MSILSYLNPADLIVKLAIQHFAKHASPVWEDVAEWLRPKVGGYLDEDDIVRLSKFISGLLWEDIETMSPNTLTDIYGAGVHVAEPDVWDQKVWSAFRTRAFSSQLSVETTDRFWYDNYHLLTIRDVEYVSGLAERLNLTYFGAVVLLTVAENMKSSPVAVRRLKEEYRDSLNQLYALAAS